jgi:hypothetical protein
VVIDGEVGSYTIIRGRKRVRYQGKQANAVGGGSSPEKRESGGGCFKSGEARWRWLRRSGVDARSRVEAAGLAHEKQDAGKKGVTTATNSFYTAVVGERLGWRGVWSARPRG